MKLLRVLAVAAGLAWAAAPRIPLAKVVPEATFDVPKAPDWMAIDESVWVSHFPENVITRIDPKANKVVEQVKVGKGPCSGLA